MLDRNFVFRFRDREMVGPGDLEWFAEVSGARKRFNDLPPPQLLQKDKLVLDQLLPFDPKLTGLLQIVELFVQIFQPVIVSHKTQSVGLRMPKELGQRRQPIRIKRSQGWRGNEKETYLFLRLEYLSRPFEDEFSNDYAALAV